ncbi:MAG: hypothetical protein IMZ66_09460, partial [Planctomycetes bacterium]|nr:hypothetical protein [Planctomycetota bacterium]
GELAALARQIEDHFGHPVDVEWGWAGGRFALLQARPIRGLDVAEDVEIGRQELVHHLRGLADGRRRVWILHNLAETLRTPMPLTWDIIRCFMTGDGGFGRLYRHLGYRPSREVCREGFLELIGGRIYADPERVAGLFWDGMPLTYDTDALVADKSLLDRAPTRFDPNRADGRFLAKLPGNLVAMWRASGRIRRARRDARRAFEEDVLPPYLGYVEAKRGQDLSGLSDEALVAELQDRAARVLDEFGPESLKPGFFGGMAFDELTALLAQLMGRDDGEAIASALTRGLEGDTTFEQDAMLYQVARGGATMDDFLARYGHRAVGEMELAEPRWREDPAYLVQMAARLRSAPGRGPEEIHRDNVAKRQAAERGLPDLLRRWGGSCFRERIGENLAQAQALLPYRESGKHYLMMGYELLRQVTEELARRWDLGTAVYFLRLDELGSFAGDRPRLADLAAQRRVRWQSQQRLDLPDVIDSDDLDGLGLARHVEAATELEGTAVAAGVATGIARIVLNPGQAGDLGTDYVLVCPSTDPGWTPLFVAARALVVERGGVLSHGAIVARDFGIPAVVCPNATRRLPDGARVRVDGNHGRIVVIKD